MDSNDLTILDKHQDLVPITQHDIECDMRKFVRWLNEMADMVNWAKNVYYQLKEQVLDHERRISCLEERVDDHEERIKELEKCCAEVQNWLNNFNLDAYDQAINMLNDRLDWIYNHLPAAYGLIPETWKFGMGNINVMSDNSGTPSIEGAGIFTSMAIEDNDIYFN